MSSTLALQRRHLAWYATRSPKLAFVPHLHAHASTTINHVPAHASITMHPGEGDAVRYMAPAMERE